ncbi:MAG TPA: hypothetical protein VGM88_31560 [Kofleriaceae bacterium]|jgi:hypothetical protein
MELVAQFFVGALLCNSLPHLLAGVQGLPFMSPFGKPSGVGRSSPLVNFLWGTANLVGALALFAYHPFPIAAESHALVALAGWLASGTFAALHFGKVQRAAT